jgi:AP-4 complex subunit sigma-1
MFNIEKAHYILDEMLMNGHIIETSKSNVLAPVKLMDKLAAATSA